MIQLFVSVLLYFVIFFGIAFILNMLLRTTWLMAFLYPVVVLLIIDDLPVSVYFTSPISSAQTAFSRIAEITAIDWIILASGLVGAIVSGIVIKLLRRSGYRMF
ncbi:YuiB family protein [Virgibacillus oceani]